MLVIFDIVKRNVNVLGLSGLIKMLYSVLYNIFKNNYPRLANTFLVKRDNILFEFINELYLQIDKVPLQSPHKDCDNTIWVFWWQGEQDAPKVIHYCINSIRKHALGWNVVVISKDNIKEYLTLPDYIYQKLGRGISFVQLSDIVRVSLISTYGGGWIDAGMLITSDIPIQISNYTYFTIKNSYRKTSLVSQFRWTGSFMFGKPQNPLISQMYKLFLIYWKENDYLTEYFLIDYFEAFLYDKDIVCKKLIDAVPISNDRLYHDGLSKYWNKEYDNHIYNEITESTWVHRLTYKADYSKNDNTFFNRIVKDYM